MIILKVFYKQHKSIILSTVALLVAGLPMLFFSVGSYEAFFGATLLRGILLYGAGIGSMEKAHEEYAIQVAKSDFFRKVLVGRIARMSVRNI